MTKQPRYTRLLLGKLKHYKRDEQVADSRKVVKALGLPAIGKSVYEHGELDLYIHNLYGNECAVLPTLEILAGERGRGVSRRFYNNLAAVERKCLFVLDVETQTRSYDDGWQKLVDRVAGSLINGRKLPPERASEMGKRHSGLIGRWKRKKGTPEYLAAAKVWSNMAITPAELAVDNLPDKQLREAHKTTIGRIFGSRTACGVWVNKQLKTKEPSSD